MSNVVDNKDRNNDIESRINEIKLNIIQFMAEIQDCDSEVKKAENVLKVTNTNVKNAEDRLIDLGFEIQSDFIKNNIRCNAIAPGTVHTPSWEGRVQTAKDPVQAKKDFIARQPMGRLGTAEEIATLAVYLASDESEFVTGIAHAIDGGLSI